MILAIVVTVRIQAGIIVNLVMVLVTLEATTAAAINVVIAFISITVMMRVMRIPRRRVMMMWGVSLMKKLKLTTTTIAVIAVYVITGIAHIGTVMCLTMRMKRLKRTIQIIIATTVLHAAIVTVLIGITIITMFLTKTRMKLMSSMSVRNPPRELTKLVLTN